MKIGIFYRDAFQPGGVPGEIIAIANTLAESHEVSLWGRTGKIPDNLRSQVQPFQYADRKGLSRTFSVWLAENRPDCILLVGFFMLENLAVARLAKKYNITVILNPLAQVTDQVLAGKIFTKDPDVRKLEQAGLQLPNFRESMMRHVNPIAKRLYLNTAGRMLVQQSNKIAVFSEYEARQFRKYWPLSKAQFLTLRWGLDHVAPETDQVHYFRHTLGLDDSKANYVYWGRMDWYYKGIERLLNGVVCCQRRMGNNTLPFRIFLIGPDYHGGVKRIEEFIRKNNLQEIVHLQLPGSYPAGSKAPLRDADASLYLSRWDGFPRTLRESTLLEVPVLISEETHFGELVSAYESGVRLENADDSEQVADGLLLLAEQDARQRFHLGARRLAPELAWRQVVLSLISETVSHEIESFPERMALP